MSEQISIIAEMAQGFEGSYTQARLLIKAASSAGADAAKFQLVYADELATPDYKYYSLFQSLEMSDEEWVDLAAYAKECRIELYLDIFGTRSLRLSEKAGINCIKLHGTDIANIGLLNEVAASSVRKVILGAGGAYLSEIEKALSILGNKEVIILLGFQGYPTPDDTNHVSRINLLQSILEKKYTNYQLGFADHASPDSALRYAIASAAVGAGAIVIEKHLTLGKVMKMEDHESALNPDEFSEFCNVLRICKTAMGQAKQEENLGMSEAELGYRNMIRRHVVAAHDLSKGNSITPADIILKRSSEEKVITDLMLVYDKTINRDIKANSAILQTDIL
jgi:sialic acid synthase SpsE